MEKSDQKALKKRYLIWFYKTTKEALDKIERKFTQIGIDQIVLKELKKQDKGKRASKLIAEFEAYVKVKENDGLFLKFEGKDLKTDYYFLEIKLRAVEKAILKTLGNAALSEIKALYEKEMTERILKSTEGK
jgi:hypothetical protein